MFRASEPRRCSVTLTPGDVRHALVRYLQMHGEDVPAEAEMFRFNTEMKLGSVEFRWTEPGESPREEA